MWLFTKCGFIDVVQDRQEPDKLLVRTQVEADLDAFVKMLDKASGTSHTVEPTVDGDYRFMAVAARDTVAQVVAQMVNEIDYTTFKRAAHFDLGKDNTYVVMLGPNDLQVAQLLKQK